MGSETDRFNPRRRPSDLYGGLATATESGLLISPTSEWDLKQRRVWPPAPYQAYCEKHFLQECLVYFSLEKEKIEEHDQKKKEKEKDRNQASEAEPLPSTAAASKIATQQQQQPTRVQPGRRAKASSATARSETQATTSSSSSSSRRRAYQDFSDSESEKMERRQELCLELSWAEFQAKLEALIKRASKKLGRKQAKKSSPHSRATVAGGKKKKTEACAEGDAVDDEDQCPLRGLIKVECRYCDHRPEIAGGGGGGDDADDAGRPPPPPPNRGAPVAPMHMLGEADFGSDQACTFGGLTFAVDVCGGAESVTVVLIKMRSLDLGLGRKDGEKDGGGDAGSVPKLPAQPSNKRAKTGKKQERSEDLNWIPEDETD